MGNETPHSESVQKRSKRGSKEKPKETDPVVEPPLLPKPVEIPAVTELSVEQLVEIRKAIINSSRRAYEDMAAALPTINVIRNEEASPQAPKPSYLFPGQKEVPPEEENEVIKIIDLPDGGSGKKISISLSSLDSRASKRVIIDVLAPKGFREVRRLMDTGYDYEVKAGKTPIRLKSSNTLRYGGSRPMVLREGKESVLRFPHPVTGALFSPEAYFGSMKYLHYEIDPRKKDAHLIENVVVEFPQNKRGPLFTSQPIPFAPSGVITDIQAFGTNMAIESGETVSPQDAALEYQILSQGLLYLEPGEKNLEKAKLFAILLIVRTTRGIRIAAVYQKID